MMIGAVIVVHSIYPEKLLQSIADENTPLRLYMFFHGDDDDIKARLLLLLGKTANLTLLLYATNRGLARSWNEGVRFSQQAGDELTLLLNDDLHFRPGGFVQFLEFVRSVEPDFGLVTVRGLEAGNSPHAGHILAQDLACCVIGQKALDTIGYFDPAFGPAYFEDLDYLHRLRLAGLPVVIDERVLVEHERGSTSRKSEVIKTTFPTTFVENMELYRRKWGGDFNSEVFHHPYNDPTAPCRLDYDIVVAGSRK